MTPEWFTEAIEGAIYDTLSDRLASLRYRLENWVNPPPPDPYAEYFSRHLLSHAVDILHFADVSNKEAARTIRFFKNAH